MPSSLTQKTLLSHSFSLGRNLGMANWVPVLQGLSLANQCCLGYHHLKAWLGEDLLPNSCVHMAIGRPQKVHSKLPHMAVSRGQVLSGYWPETSVFCHMGLPMVLFTTEHPCFSRVRAPRKTVREGQKDRGHRFLQPSLRSNITTHLPCSTTA